MPNSELEWILLYIGLGYLLAAATAASAIFFTSLKYYAARGPFQKFVSTVALLTNFILFVIALGHVLPLVFSVSDTELASRDLSRDLLIYLCVSGVLTMGCVIYSLHYLNQVIRNN